jgi:3,4-dihydroxy 2-butanone 4-phosphate synthase/GTP cyclohydrolase II
MSPFTTIEDAIDELRHGRMVILVDDENREQEGDIVVAAEKISPEAVNFMITHARGMLCLTVTEALIQRLQIPMMPVRNQQPNQAAFAVSIEAVHGVTSGTSAFDRAKTIQTAVNPSSTPADIALPGHVLPIVAQSGGVLERPGHTEGSVDLVRLAGFEPAAVICEVMRADGRMSRLPELIEFAKQHQLKLVSINDLIAYRNTHA